MRIPTPVALLSLLLTLGIGIAEAAAQPIGSTVRIVNKVTGDLNQQKRDLSIGDQVSQNEVIEVATDALGEIKLNDDTKLALGPGARMTLDKFVYDPSARSGTVAANLVTGAFRFITGLTRKPAYQIRTPSASITVRGTVFDIYVDAAGGTWLLLHEGSVRVCNNANQCVNVDNPCGVVYIAADGTVQGPVTWPGRTQQVDFATAFPFVVTPPSVDANPRFTRTQVELNQCRPERERTERAAAEPQDTPYEPQQPSPSSYVPPAATPVPQRNWTGVYIGVHAGGSWSPADTDVGCYDPGGAFDGTPNCFGAIYAGALLTDYSLDASGFVGGVQAGFDVRVGNVVLGIVTDFSHTSIDGSTTSVTNREPTYRVEVASLDEEVHWLGTVRGRAGIAQGNVLVYVTGGLAYAQVDTRYTLALPAVNGFAQASDSGWQAGWAAGAGGEISFGVFTISADYFYYDLGSQELNARGFAGGAATATIFQPEFDIDGHVFRLGTNFPLN